MKSAEACFSTSYAQRRKIRQALEDSSLYNAVLEELLSGIDGDCTLLYTRSIQRAGIETKQPSKHAHVKLAMSDLAQSARLCDSNGFKLTRMMIAVFHMNEYMFAILERVLQRMVRVVVTCRQIRWDKISAAATEMIKNLMKRVNEWWINDMRVFYNRGEPRPCIVLRTSSAAIVVPCSEVLSAVLYSSLGLLWQPNPCVRVRVFSLLGSLSILGPRNATFVSCC
jgi:hypothetical protein